MTRRRARLVVGTVVAAVLAVDQASKSWALSSLADGPVDLFWTLRLRLAFNSGAAFSIGEGFPWFFAVLAVVVLGALALLARRTYVGPATATGLGLVAGGAIGNLVDRVFRDHGGAVVDFIDLQWWPVFNLADASLCVGIGLLLLSWGRSDGAEEDHDQRPQASYRSGAEEQS